MNELVIVSLCHGLLRFCHDNCGRSRSVDMFFMD